MARSLAVVLALVALPVGATACGGGKGTSGNTTATSAAAAKQAVQAAAQKTAEVGSVDLALTASTTASGAPVLVQGTGAFDTKAHKGRLHLGFSAGALSSTADVVLDGTSIYLHSPLFAVGVPGGKPWIKLDLRRGAKAAGIDLSKLLAQDPTQALDALTRASRVTELGPAQVQGVPTTRYRAHVSAAAGSPAPPGTYEVWVGNDGYIHRVRTVVPAAGGAKVTATSTLSGFGDPVSVTVPPAAKTYTSTTGTLPVPAG
jgi:hypothetical protein